MNNIIQLLGMNKVTTSIYFCVCKCMSGKNEMKLNDTRHSHRRKHAHNNDESFLLLVSFKKLNIIKDPLG